MSRTTNLNLKKPEGNEYVNIEDLNENMEVLDKAIGRIDNDVVVTLPLSGWSAAAPYTIRVAVSGVKAEDNPELKVYTPKTLDAATVKLRQKLTGMITDGMTEDGYVTLYCGVKKPTADFVVLLKGVSVNG